MHLAEVLMQRPVPAAAVFLALTRRCPLSCRHCSTNSMLDSEQHPEELFRRFVDTFTPDCHPDLVLMTGGEALLRPALVEYVARRARAVGARTSLLSGMYFVRGRRVPAPILRAIDAVDMFSASLDAFHEEEVSRDAVLSFLGRLAEAGKDVSLQVVGLSDDDPYLAEVTAEVRERLGDRVPVLVGLVGAAGRATQWLERPSAVGDTPPPAAAADPCVLAAWPVVSFDGWVAACCNQDILDNGIPEHLRLGHVSTDGWPVLQERCRTRPMLRALRLLGPQALAARAGVAAKAGYCATCVGLAGEPAASDCAAALTERPATPLLEAEVLRLQQAGGAAAFVRRKGSARYAELAELGLGSRR
jgi:pyruvate-formate lyase-activating enzyme